MLASSFPPFFPCPVSSSFPVQPPGLCPLLLSACVLEKVHLCLYLCGNQARPRCPESNAL